MKSIYSIIVLSLFIVSGALASDTDKEPFSKSVKKEYDISKNGQVELSNKYGNIDVSTNDGSKVIITVEIIVNAKNEDVANTAFERINIDFSASSDLVRATTELSSEKGNWWSGSSKSYDFEINYQVSIPRTVRLDVDNSYGDVYITELDNDLDLEVKYGNFSVVSAETVDLEAKYGSGEIEKCKDITADLGYVSGEGFKVGSCVNATFDSKYSKIIVGNAKSIIADAGYDNYDVGDVEIFKLDGNYNKINVSMVGDFSTDTRYTNINIGELKSSGDIEMGYGGLDIYKVHNGFSSIAVDSDYAGVTIGMASDASYNFDLDATYAGIETPANAKIDIKEKESKSIRLKGSVGSSTSGSIKVTSDYGGIEIR